MEKFDDIGKKMPYQESEEYLDNLIANVTETAVEKGNSGRMQRILWPAVSIAAAAAVLLFVFIGRNSETPKPSVHIAQNTESPVDDFLDGLSGDDLMQLSDYEVEEISLSDYEEYFE
ncbi:MAG: hypothetical protein IJG54_01350 [Bacteroidales bacterium]|nr:hypothetical protein [Bacteroidales bacterium]